MKQNGPATAGILMNALISQAMNTSANFNVSYQVSPCGGRLDGPDNITSPSFPSSYPTNTECIWLLEFNWNSQIKLTFTDLDLDDSQDSDGACNRDYVVIRNGQYSTSPLLGKYCGTNLPQEIRSMSRYLFIEFHSDENSNGNRRGFRIEAEAIERGKLQYNFASIILWNFSRISRLLLFAT